MLKAINDQCTNYANTLSYDKTEEFLVITNYYNMKKK